MSFLTDVRDKNHEKTFRAWVNKYLRHKQRKIEENLMDGLKDGVNFIHLVEMITGKAVTQKYFKNPVMNIQCIENVSIGLACLKKARANFKIDIEPKDVYDGNVKVVLGLVWQMILRFQIMKDGEFTSSNPMQDAKDRVLKWWRDLVGDVVPIDGMHSFKDGKAYFAAVNKIMGLNDSFESLDARQCLTKSMALAEQHLGILPLLEVDDILADNPKDQPDERCLLTYLSEYPAAYELKLRNKTAMSAADEALAKLKAEHEAADKAAAAEAERLRRELARQSMMMKQETEQAREEARRREEALSRQKEAELAAAREAASRQAKQEADLLADWQAAAENDAHEALRRAQREKESATEAQKAALQAAAERKEAALRRAEAEKQALAELKATELARLRAEAAKRMRRHQLEKEQAEQESAMKAQLSKDEFMKWRREREDELARLRSDRLALEQLAREELAKLRAENERLKRGLPHKFVKKKFAGPTWCHLCKSLCWPTAYQCVRCQYTIDAKCMRRNPPANCIAAEDDEQDEGDDGQLGAEQLATLSNLPTLVSASVQWRSTKLVAANLDNDDINAVGNKHSSWTQSMSACLKAGWLLLYADNKKGKLKLVVNMAKASVLAFQATNKKEEVKESCSLVVRGRRAAHALQFNDVEQKGTWWRVLREQSAAAQGSSHGGAAAMSLGDKVLIKLWRADGGNVTLAVAADALPSEVLTVYAKKARLDSSEIGNLAIYERRAPTAGATPDSVDSSADRELGDNEPLHFLQGLRESAGKPVVFVVKKK